MTTRHLTENDLPAIAALAAGVAIQDAEPSAGVLWLNTADYMVVRGATIPIQRLYVKSDDVFRTCDGMAVYPNAIYCNRLELFAGKRLLSRPNAAQSDYYNYLTCI
jgi:hypothetical protein